MADPILAEEIAQRKAIREREKKRARKKAAIQGVQTRQKKRKAAAKNGDPAAQAYYAAVYSARSKRTAATKKRLAKEKTAEIRAMKREAKAEGKPWPPVEVSAADLEESAAIERLDALAGGVEIPRPDVQDLLRAKLMKFGQDLDARKRRRSSVGSKLTTVSGVQALSAAIRYLDGGRARFLELVQLAMLNGDPAAIDWWTIFVDLTPVERARVNLDDVCAAANIKPSMLMAACVGAAMEFGADVGQMVAAAAMPALVGAMVKSAERIDGDYAEVAQKDRHALLQQAGVIPAQRGSVINVHAQATAGALAAAQGASSDPSVPNYASDMQRALEAARVVQHEREGLGPAMKTLTALPDKREIESSGRPSVIDTVPVRREA